MSGYWTSTEKGGGASLHSKTKFKDVGKTLMISGGILSLGDEKPSKLTRKSWLIPSKAMIEISI